jgi:hypothetical protein
MSDDRTPHMMQMQQLAGGVPPTDLAKLDASLAEQLGKSISLNAQLRIRIEALEAALRELYDLCQTLGNFKNGVEHQGIDEGEVYASGVFDIARAALAPEQDK